MSQAEIFHCWCSILQDYVFLYILIYTTFGARAAEDKDGSFKSLRVIMEAKHSEPLYYTVKVPVT